MYWLNYCVLFHDNCGNTLSIKKKKSWLFLETLYEVYTFIFLQINFYKLYYLLLNAYLKRKIKIIVYILNF